MNRHELRKIISYLGTDDVRDIIVKHRKRTTLYFTSKDANLTHDTISPAKIYMVMVTSINDPAKHYRGYRYRADLVPLNEEAR